jgi:DNA-binding response OmpR family regulator
MKILIVDSDFHFVEFLEVFLRSQGHSVDRAFNAADALLQTRSFKPELILLNTHLESESGIHLLPELLMEQVSASVVMLTGMPSSENAVEAIKRGASDYLEKPVNYEKLNQAIQSHRMLCL